MKLESPLVRFVTPFPSPGRTRVRFVSRGHSLQLLETALIFEGPLKKLWLPFLDWMLSPLLAEKTLVTVPYSRVLGYWYTVRPVLRSVVTLLCLLPVALLSVLLVALELPPWANALITCISAALMIAYANLRLVASRSTLLFQAADGGKVVVAFRIRSAGKRLAFEEQLENNRRTAAGLCAPRPAALQPPRRRTSLVPLFVLLVYLLQLHLLRPLFAASTRSLATTLPMNRFARPIPGGMVFVPAPPPTTPLSILGQFLLHDGIVLLLALLLWRWNNVLRWVTVGVLLIAGGVDALAFVEPAASRSAGSSDWGFVFPVALAVVLAVTRQPQHKGNA
jgi:hypothetical protein